MYFTVTPVCTVLLLKAIQKVLDISLESDSKIIASGILGTLFMWRVLGALFNAIGGPDIWSMLRKYPNLEVKANLIVYDMNTTTTTS